MAKTAEERLQELQKKQAQLKQQEKELKQRISKENRKADTHRKIEIGGTVESVCRIHIEKEDLPKLLSFLKNQEQRGHYFAKAMGYRWREAKDKDGNSITEYYVPENENNGGEKEKEEQSADGSVFPESWTSDTTSNTTPTEETRRFF